MVHAVCGSHTVSGADTIAVMLTVDSWLCGMTRVWADPQNLNVKIVPKIVSLYASTYSNPNTKYRA